MSRYLVIFQSIVLCVIIILFVSYRSDRHTDSPPPIVSTISATTSPLRMSLSPAEYPYLSPVIVADHDRHFIINFKPLRDKLQATMNAQKNKTYVYFLYLNNASWIGLNEKDYFTAASTIKVPLAMSILKFAEKGRVKMTDSYTLTDLDLDPGFGDLYKVGPDGSFTLDEFVQIMLEHSDNTSMRALFTVMNMIDIKTPLDDVYAAMGWERSNKGDNLTYIDINLKTLANMFVSLYNGTYINIDNSNKLLEYLAHSDFKDQIPAGVPDSVSVAHKIGVNEPNNTYSDCGIVYVPSRPYILCVGSVGVPKKVADSFISKISRTVYEYVITN